MKLIVILLFVMFAAMFAVVYLGGCSEPKRESSCAEWVRTCIYTQSAAFSPSNPENADACVRAAKQIGVCK